MPYTHQFVRDLAWLFSSPPILNFGNAFNRLPLEKSWLDELDNNPQQLTEHLSSKNLKMLGPYFEALWEFYFIYYPKVELVAKNLQVFDGGKTIGEFDFIYRELETNKVFHLEVAVKYYLGNARAINGIQESAGLDLTDAQAQCLWVGPGTRDRLDRKARKLAQHQSQLSSNEAGIAALRRVGVREVTSQVCLLGYLFYPTEYEMDKPTGANSNHLRGCWMRLNDIQYHLKRESRFAILDKPHWLAPVAPEGLELLDQAQLVEELSHQFAEIPHPRLIAEFTQVANKSSEPDQCFARLSSEFYFITPESWPKR